MLDLTSFEIDIATVDGVYPYESAWCAQTLVVFKKDDEWRAAHNWLAEEMGRQPDNKEIYRLTLMCGRTIYLGFFDCRVRLSLEIRDRQTGLGYIKNPSVGNEP